MGANYKEEMKKIKERYDDIVQKNNGGGSEEDNDTEENRAASKKFFQFEQENELDERNTSFRLQTYNNVPQDDKDKFSTLKATVKRFVIVLVFITVICGTVYLASKWLAKKRLKTYVLRGNETHFESFVGLPIQPDELGAISLENVRLRGPELLRALEGYNRLTSIRLENVKIEEGFNETVLLPALTDYVYAETMEKKSIVDIMSAMTEPKLKSILFFRNANLMGVGNQVMTTMKKSRDKPENLDLTRVWDFEVNVNVTLEGYTILYVNHTEEELVLPWLTYLKREAVLENAGRAVKRLSCNRLRLSIDSLHPQITHLSLRDVKLVGGDFNALVKRFYKLKELRISFGEVTSVDLASLPWKTLRHLALSRASLSHSAGSGSGKRAKLKSLTLLNPSFNWEVVQQFDKLFQLNQLAISEYHINANETQVEEIQEAGDPNGLLIRNALKTEAERVFMYKFRRVTNPNDRAMERWFNATGIPKGTSSFVLDKIASQWNLRSLDWNEWSSYKHRAMGLDKLWSHSGSI